MTIDFVALQKTLRKLGINFITLGIIGLMLKNVANLAMYNIHVVAVILLVVGLIIWFIGLVKNGNTDKHESKK